MERIPVFSVHSISPSTNNEPPIIHGRALNIVQTGCKLFYSEAVSDSNYCFVDIIKNETNNFSSLSVMDSGTITIRAEQQIAPIGQYLFGESVNKYIPTITLEETTRMAMEAAQKDLSRYAKDPHTPYLQNSVLEAECCWFFFYNPEIEIPEQDWVRRMLGAYAVSKKGEMSHTYNFSDDPIKLQDYLQTMSAYFKRRGK
ncbi:hypothetical protein [Paenibacillus ginsengarvi]|uniref:Uncharacterized protein n=1 Tax=Paenibacillus ginsengarvi TaxID=400777 RepID=A0A3B0ARL6_9BACL|nr:hypothetical protein [Paenibacillus ginsengarvi]RKN61997.1 hypothetical protein D7M11_35125 [Paenibacillus ginsengarvi]